MRKGGDVVRNKLAGALLEVRGVSSAVDDAYDWRQQKEVLPFVLPPLSLPFETRICGKQPS